MEDRQAPRRRPLTQGIPAKPIGALPMNDGIPLEDGILQGPESIHGIPTGPIIKSKPKGPAQCTATTKKGSPCKAYATKDSEVCIGHSRSDQS